MAAERGCSCAPVAMRRVPKRVERVAVLQGRPVGLSKATVCGTSGPSLHARRTVAFTGPHWGRHHVGRTVGEDAVCSLQTPRSPFMSEKDRKREKEWKEREGKKAGQKKRTRCLTQWFSKCGGEREASSSFVFKTQNIATECFVYVGFPQIKLRMGKIRFGTTSNQCYLIIYYIY